MKACTAEQMRQIDARAVSEFGMPSLLLMEHAGRAVAMRAMDQARVIQRERPVVVVCGKGNNGGDGFVAARLLFNRGVPVRCRLVGEPDALRGDAATNLELMRKLGVPFEVGAPAPDDLRGAALVVDALLGTGFQGAPRGGIGTAIEAINASGVPVLAVDTPSGLDTDTGQTPGECVRAVETVTFGLPKVGLLSHPGRSLAGEITVAEISLPRPLLEEDTLNLEWITAEDATPFWPPREIDAHKGDSGRLFVLGGSPGLTGAPAMTCDAALRAGAGLVNLGIPASLNAILEVKLTEAMTLPLPETEQGELAPEALPLLRERLAAAGALAVGPGFGRDARSAELLRGLLKECGLPVVIDADALTLLSPAGADTFPPGAVLTPHAGEMARLLGTEVSEIQSNRLGTARSAAERFGCVVLLKGAGTVVAAPDGRAAINSSGGPALATGGSGDVLTGIIGACLARGVAPFEAAVAGAFLHGVAGELAGERLGAPGAVAGDVIAAIPEALRKLRMREIPLPCRMI